MLPRPLSLPFCLLLWPLCFAGHALVGQSYDGSTAHLRKLSLEDGLPAREVHSVVRDTNGVMWSGTANQIVRYDGYGFEAMEGFEQEFRGSFTVGADGLIYSPHPRHLDSVEIFDPYRLASFGFRAGNFHGGSAQIIPQAHRGPLTYCSGDTIYGVLHLPAPDNPYAVGNLSPFSLHPLPSPLKKKERIIHADGAGYVIQSDKEVTIHQNGRTQSVALPTNQTVSLLKRLGDGRILCLTERGGYQWKPGSKKFELLPPDLLPPTHFNYLDEDAAGNLLVGYLNPQSLRLERLRLLADEDGYDLSWLFEFENRVINSFGDNFLRAIELASYGGINLVEFENVRERNFMRFMHDADTRKSKFGHVMRGFTSDDLGNVYTNKDSDMDAWFRVAPGANRVDTLAIMDEFGRPIDQLGCGTNMINMRGHVYGHSCYRYPDSTRAHLYRFDPYQEKWKVSYLPDLNQVIRYLVPDEARGCIWMPTQNALAEAGGRLYKYDLTTELISEVDILGGESSLQGYPRDATLSADGRYIWIASTSGLFRYGLEDRELCRFILPGDRPTRLSVILPALEGGYLLGTFGAGLWHFNPETEAFTHRGGLYEKSGSPTSSRFIRLPNNSIAGIAPGETGGLIITTFNGLTYFENGSANNFTRREGLTDNEFNTTSLHYDSLSGRYYAGGLNGFVSFTSQDLERRPSDYTPTLLRYRKLDENSAGEETVLLPSASTGTLVIPPSVAYFSLEFAIPDYREGKDLLYETRLEGLDPDWRMASSSPLVRYTRLPAGDYTFHLRGMDAKGNATREIRPLSIRVLRPWYKQTWAYFLFTAMFASLIGAIVWVRFSRLRERYEAEKKVQTLELRTLRQQMNPHFISNAMNAIREFVFQKDPDRAAGYLTDFSRLMRLFLEASRSPMTTVGNEVDLIGHYVRLEQLRFPGQFSYRVVVDEQIDPEMDEVPSFLVQPIVENAINHGLRPLATDGELTVSFRLDEEDDDTLIISVTDNGVGRQAAGKRADRRGHASRSTQILQEREALLTSDKSLLFTMKTTDLHPGNERPGTSVTITIATRPVD